MKSFKTLELTLNMRKAMEQVLKICLLVFALSGCSNLSAEVPSRMEEEFRTIVAVQDLNKSLELTLHEDKENFPRGHDIPILVENKSAHFLSFNYTDNYIKLYIIKDGEWVEVKNGLTYSGAKTLHPQGAPLLNLDATWARPELDDNLFEDNQTDILVRIVMTGEIVENDTQTGEFVSAYVDVYISSIREAGAQA
jgi:hypothetical protein